MTKTTNSRRILILRPNCCGCGGSQPSEFGLQLDGGVTSEEHVSKRAPSAFAHLSSSMPLARSASARATGHGISVGARRLRGQNWERRTHETPRLLSKVSREEGAWPLHFGTAWGRGLPLRPREELIERRTEGLAPLGQVVLDLWRHLWVDAGDLLTPSRFQLCPLMLRGLYLSQEFLQQGRGVALLPDHVEGQPYIHITTGFASSVSPPSSSETSSSI